MTPGDLPDPEIKLASPALAGGFLTNEPPGKPLQGYTLLYIFSRFIGRKHFCYFTCMLLYSPNQIVLYHLIKYVFTVSKGHMAQGV